MKSVWGVYESVWRSVRECGTVSQLKPIPLDTQLAKIGKKYGQLTQNVWKVWEACEKVCEGVCESVWKFQNIWDIMQ